MNAATVVTKEYLDKSILFNSHLVKTYPNVNTLANYIFDQDSSIQSLCAKKKNGYPKSRIIRGITNLLLN